MIVTGPGWRLVYSGDLCSSKELAPYAANCDLLIHELAHPHPEEIADFAETVKIPHLLISHIGAEYDEAPEKIARIFADRYSGRLTVAADGTKVQLNKSTE